MLLANCFLRKGSHMKLALYVLLAAVPLTASAAPFVVSDPLDPRATHCGVLLDAAAKVTIPVTAATGGNICKFDVGGIANGSHTIRMTAIAIDPIWGSQESAESSPLSFVKPAPPATPGLLRLQP
jgi:hypothetical protein